MRVLVLRPEAEAHRTAARLAARGHEAVVAPVLSIRAWHEPAPEGAFDVLVLTSANALIALAEMPAAVRRLPVLAVGERTGEVARAAGFADVLCAEGDRISLAVLARRVLPTGARLLLALGREHKDDTIPLLAAAGLIPVPWITYAADAVPALPAAAVEALAAGRIDAVLHYSRRSATIGLALAEAAGVAPALLAGLQVCLSEDVAAPLRAAGAARIAVARQPDEAALLAALDGAAGA